MSHQSGGPVSRPATVALCLMLACVATAVIAVASAKAGNYKMVLCAANNGSGSFETATNTAHSGNPGGIFRFENYCGPAPDPAGNKAFLRIAENQSAGYAGETAYGSISWTAPAWVSIRAAGGYTRMPGSFNDGWRGRFWAEDFGGGGHHILMQGTHASNSGINWSPTSTFAPHLWPFSGYGDFRRFVFELTCYRPAGCDRSGWNAVDANTLVLILADKRDPQVAFEGSATINGQWVRGEQALAWHESDEGSGLRFSRLKVDGATLGDGTIDYRATGGCDIGSSGPSGEFARRFDPCAKGPYRRHYGLRTQELSDGAHQLAICVQDYGQQRGMDATGGESCERRTIRTDNTAPGRPAALTVTSANPERYLPRFGARFSLPPNQGSPIAKVHYEIVDAAGRPVRPRQTLSATDPTSLTGIEGPADPGDYRLRVWLQDGVGHAGPAAEAPVPRDTTPPAAPQELRVTGPTSHRVERFGLRWRNVLDAGSPIDTARYQVLDGAGDVVVPTQRVTGENVEAIEGVRTPPQRGAYTVRVWLADEEGNVGAPASVPVPRDTTPPAAPQDVSVAAPRRSRAVEGFDLRWRNIVDDGSPIAAAHYRVLSAGGGVVVPTTTVGARNIERIASLRTPRDRGGYTLRLWLSDAEGNVGAPVSVLLAYDCVRSQARGASRLSARLGGGRRAPDRVVRQGRGATLSGTLRGPGGPVAGAPVCVFSSVLTDPEREFLGIAMTGPDGGYRFAISRGPSRAISSVHRPDQRQLSASATLYTRVRPLLRARRRVVRNKHFARFFGRIPGPRNDRVVVVLQVRQGKGWRAFRRYRTRNGGRYRLVYRFGRTTSPATYVMRAQVRRQGGYPYLPGNSRPLRLHVVP